MVVNEDEIYNKAIEVYGKDIQIVCAIEELSELITALSQYLRGRADANVEEEIADALNMMGQLCRMFDNNAVKEIKRAKLIRLVTRLERRKN